MLTDIGTLISLIFALIVDVGLIVYLLKSHNKNQLSKMFLFTLFLLFIMVFSLILQITLSKPLGIKPIYFEYLVYIGTCFVPVGVFFIGLIYLKKEIKFKAVYLLTLVIPIISLIALWTNDSHHLFYQYYSVQLSATKYGPFSDIHTYYSYIMLGLGIFYLLKSTIKSSGILSKQSILILLGVSVPIVVNILGTFEIFNMSIYITPITFIVTVVMCAIAIFKFQFLGIAPIALQMVVNQISDSYVVLGVYNNVIDFNDTFVKTFKLTKNKIKNKNFNDLLIQVKTPDLYINKIMDSIKQVSNSNKIIHFEQEFKELGKIFEVEVTPIISNQI